MPGGRRRALFGHRPAELATSSLQEYEALALELAKDRGRLQSIRRKLAEKPTDLSAVRQRSLSPSHRGCLPDHVGRGATRRGSGELRSGTELVPPQSDCRLPREARIATLTLRPGSAPIAHHGWHRTTLFRRDRDLSQQNPGAYPGAGSVSAAMPPDSPPTAAVRARKAEKGACGRSRIEPKQVVGFTRRASVAISTAAISTSMIFPGSAPPLSFGIWMTPRGSRNRDKKHPRVSVRSHHRQRTGFAPADHLLQAARFPRRRPRRRLSRYARRPAAGAWRRAILKSTSKAMNGKVFYTVRKELLPSSRRSPASFMLPNAGDPVVVRAVPPRARQAARGIRGGPCSRQQRVAVRDVGKCAASLLESPLPIENTINSSRRIGVPTAPTPNLPTGLTAARLFKF